MVPRPVLLYVKAHTLNMNQILINVLYVNAHRTGADKAPMCETPHKSDSFSEPSCCPKVLIKTSTIPPPKVIMAEAIHTIGKGGVRLIHRLATSQQRAPIIKDPLIDVA